MRRMLLSGVLVGLLATTAGANHVAFFEQFRVQADGAVTWDIPASGDMASTLAEAEWFWWIHLVGPYCQTDAVQLTPEPGTDWLVMRWDAFHLGGPCGPEAPGPPATLAVPPYAGSVTFWQWDPEHRTVQCATTLPLTGAAWLALEALGCVWQHEP
jgi:hypothetical protein